MTEFFFSHYDLKHDFILWLIIWWENGKQLQSGEGGDRGQDDWMASSTQWTWVWASSGRWWWTGKLGVLQSMGLQRVRHNWATERQQQQYFTGCCAVRLRMFSLRLPWWYVLQSAGLQNVRHDLATEQQQYTVSGHLQIVTILLLQGHSFLLPQLCLVYRRPLSLSLSYWSGISLTSSFSF